MCGATGYVSRGDIEGAAIFLGRVAEGNWSRRDTNLQSGKSVTREGTMATTVTVYFATNRQPLTDGGDKIIGFSSELGPIGGLDVRYGRAEVEVDLKKGTNTMVPGSLEIAAQKLIFAAGEAPVLGSKTIFDAIRADMT